MTGRSCTAIEGETSTNLSTFAARTDLGFIERQMQSHIVLLSAYAKLPKVVVLDSEDTDWCMQEADIVSHQLQGQMLIEGKNEFISSSAVLSEDVANMIIPLRLITGSDHAPGFWCKK